MPCLHPASLIPTNAHNPRLLCLVESNDISFELIKYAASLAVSIVGLEKKNHIMSSTITFIIDIIKAASPHMPKPIATLLTSLIYLQRFKERLGTSSAGTSSAPLRIFLASFVVASKYTNDSSLKNVHWSKVSSRFKTEEITCMERQILFLLDFDLAFTEAEALERWAPFLPTETPQMIRASAINKVCAARKTRAEAQAKSSTASACSSSSTVHELTDHISSTHLRPPLPSYPSSISSSSSNESFSGSEQGGLTDDNGSSSGSSAYPSSSEDESESEPERELAPPPRSTLRPPPSSLSYQKPPARAISRSRIPSDTSSIRTVTGHRRTSGSRRTSAIYFPAPSENSRDNRQPGGFLSRIWGAATGSTGKVAENHSVAIVDPEAQQSSTFRRLVRTRSSMFRASVAAVIDM